MSLDLMKFGLALQAASIGKADVLPASPPVHAEPASYRAPIEQVCLTCGSKFVGISCRREACQ